MTREPAVCAPTVKHSCSSCVCTLAPQVHGNVLGGGGTIREWGLMEEVGHQVVNLEVYNMAPFPVLPLFPDLPQP